MDFSRSSLVLLGHGSTRNTHSSDPVRRLTAHFAACGPFAGAHCGFLRESPDISAALRSATGGEVFVVPYFLSEGYFTSEIIPAQTGLQPGVNLRGGQTFYVCPPVGTHPAMTPLLRQTILRACEGLPSLVPSQCCLFLAGHGTVQNENSSVPVRTLVKSLPSSLPPFADVQPLFLDEEPLIRDWGTKTSAPQVLVVPYFLSDGLHAGADIPRLLGFDVEGSGWNDLFYGPHPAEFLTGSAQGKTVFYTHAIGARPEMTEVVLRLCESLCSHGHRG
ncbi:MAG: CbiX/SirB N-terminal domain-containing protein [Verrucomicrobiae bacterium]|nr:CbiX/SirB N-terminal domain-containing protein [Verrucomicrobiae bacterium]